MAEVKNNFLKSKMNKDLDDRLVPAGEYRHAQNISVAKSEGQDVGALENILGNNLVSSFTLPTDTYGVEIIGHFMDVKQDRIIVFLTNYVDISSDALSNFSPIDSYHAIGVYNILTSLSSIIVSGRFLNFSKTNEIYGINVVNNLLFWTDNRNQPRKINISNALVNSSYYTTEDTISVSKYYPHNNISLILDEVVDWTNFSQSLSGNIYTVGSNLPTTGGTGSGLTIDITAVNTLLGTITTFIINNIGIGYTNGDQIILNPRAGDATIDLVVEAASTMQDVVSDFLPDGTTPNPYRQPYSTGDISWRGNPEYLKDKFVRFSYRFKFDDNEYSLIAPFTQACFIPKQDGYFLKNDDAKTFKSTEVDFMENKVNDITLVINSPIGYWNTVNDTMNITDVDILYKEAGQNTIKIVDTITSNELLLINDDILTYSYASTKPWKTLPESEILRVHDQVPVRAFSQELIGNRIVYGNYIDKPTPPTSIDYSCSIDQKEVLTQIEYQNQNLKQNRTYQVGIVLSDRYGRQSTVILSGVDDSKFAFLVKGSTIFNKFKVSPFSTYSTGTLFTTTDVWDGDLLELQFWNTISSTKNTTTGEPGLYDAITNPLGWYTYKIVVKQEQQDYYNIYFPGILNGYIDGEAMSSSASLEEPICHFALYGDNINKVPRDLSLVGPNQTTFRSGRPSAQEDPSYYQFVDSSGLGFTVDPFSKEGERLLKERDRDKDLDSGSQITNASVKLSLRLNNVVPDPLLLDNTLTTTAQAYPKTNLDIVSTIGTGSELGLWDPAAIIPFNTAEVFYGYKNNPYIAKINVSDPIQTGIAGPHPNSGVFDFNITYTALTGTGYFAPSENVPCTIPTSSGYTISGFKVNIPVLLATASPTIADIGIGWPSVIPAVGIPLITGCKISGAGDGQAEFTIDLNSDSSNGKMAPSLAVYETQPLKSKLDIYWETSTNGLIEDLNTAIIEGDTTTPEGFEGATGGDVLYQQNEGMAIGADVTDEVWPVAPDGSRINGPNRATLLSVFDGAGVPRLNEFTLSNEPNESFIIRTNSYFVCRGDNNIKGEFTFNINIEVPGSNFVSDGLYINEDLLLGTYTLDNLPPIFTNVMIDNFIADRSITQVFNIPFTSSWDTSSAPYIDYLIKHDNEVYNPDGVYNTTTGFYTCDKSGIYDINFNCNIIGEFRAGGGITHSINNGNGVEACSSIFAQVFIRKVGTTTKLAQEIVILTYQDRIYDTGWHSQFGASGVRWNTNGTIQGFTNGWGYPSGVSRPSFENYVLNAQNQSLLVGDELEVGITAMFVGDEPYPNNAYGYAFKDLLSFPDKFYKSSAQARINISVSGPNNFTSIFSVTASNLTATTSASLIHTFSAQNGSNTNVANSLKSLSLSFSIIDDHSGLFYLTYPVTLGDIELHKVGGGISNTPYQITIRVVDGAGMKKNISFVVLLS